MQEISIFHKGKTRQTVFSITMRAPLRAQRIFDLIGMVADTGDGTESRLNEF
jgi:hypothetical protein